MRVLPHSVSLPQIQCHSFLCACKRPFKAETRVRIPLGTPFYLSGGQADPTPFPKRPTYLRHRLTNTGLEAANANIHWVKKTARGFLNIELFRTAICFHRGGLDLYPHETR